VHLNPPLLVGLHIRPLAHGDDKHGFGLGLGVVLMLFSLELVCSCLAVVWRAVITFVNIFLALSKAIGVNEKARFEP
jgi:hypothetical protein